MKIDCFRGKYFFLSNFFASNIRYNGLTFLNNEAAFQAQKCPKRASEFCELNPSDAKRLGRKVRLRSDWESVKDDVMYDVCHAKFSQNANLRRQLLNTGNAELVEGNTWGDRVWGVCGGVGENRLGRILMRIRDEMKGLD